MSLSFDLIKTIQKVSLEVMNEHALQIMFGKVANTNPLTVKVGDIWTLTEEFLVLDSPVDVGEDVIVIKYSTGNKYLILSTVEKVYQSSVNIGGSTYFDTSDGTWVTCKASAYGDSDIGNLTANGERLTSNGLTVAVPMGSFYREHRNKRMMICYNGKVVTARVTDCGNFGTGNKYTNRQLDLAPGVWKEFGFKSTSDWGLRTVQYKFVD